MAKQVLTMRVEPELIEWLEGYAKERGVSKQAVSETALLEFRELCKTGVPELVAAARRQSYAGKAQADAVGVGDCPKRPGTLGHVWVNDPDKARACSYCGMRGQDFLSQAGAERSALFSRLSVPMQNGTGKAA